MAGLFDYDVHHATPDRTPGEPIILKHGKRSGYMVALGTSHRGELK
jgi:hypothetical protein